MSGSNGHNGGNGRRSARTFCADQFPWPLIADLSDGVDVVACYIVLEKRRAETRTNKPYLKLTLGDRSGTIDAFVWEDADHWDSFCPADEVVGVRGRTASFQDRLQIKIQAVEPISADPEELEMLLAASPRDREVMERELDALIASLEDQPLRKLLRRCLGSGSSLGQEYRAHPAAKRNHHAYIGGLLEHSISVAGICDRLAAHYAAQGIPVDRDLLVAGALLHDVGKVRELKRPPASGYTTEGQLLGHIVIGIQMVAQQAERIKDLSPERLLLLQHLIASHQGKPEWDSPKSPQLREALLLHYADDLDAKFNQANALLEGVSPGEWSSYDRGFSRSFFQPPALPNSGEVEPVPAEEAQELLMDLFRG